MTKPAPKRRKDPMSLYAFRLPDALITEVDRIAKRLETEQPGMAVTRTQAVRMLLYDAIRAQKDNRAAAARDSGGSMEDELAGPSRISWHGVRPNEEFRLGIHRALDAYYTGKHVNVFLELEAKGKKVRVVSATASARTHFGLPQDASAVRRDFDYVGEVRNILGSAGIELVS